MGCELELPWVDPNDPNYESDSEKAESPKAINGKSNVDLKVRPRIKVDNTFVQFQILIP